MVLGLMLFSAADQVSRKLTRPLYPNPPDSLNHSLIYTVIRERLERCFSISRMMACAVNMAEGNG